MFLQETWLPCHESDTFTTDFPNYNFHSTSSDMYTDTEDRLLHTGAVWHGTVIGWSRNIDKHIKKLSPVNERFCGILYSESNLEFSIIAYTLYMPTSGKDEEFLEVLELLRRDILENITEKSSIIIGTDSNVSAKSTKRRITALHSFLEYFSLSSIHETQNATFHHNNGTSESQIDHIFVSTTPNQKLNVSMKSHLCVPAVPGQRISDI